MAEPWKQYQAAGPWDQYAAPTARPTSVAAPPKKAAPQISALDDLKNAVQGGLIRGWKGAQDTIAKGVRPANPLEMIGQGLDTVDQIANLIRTGQGKPQVPKAAPPVPPQRKTGAVDPNYRAKTSLGRYAGSIAEMSPALVAPGSAPARIANMVLPGVSAQGAEDIARGLGANDQIAGYARAAGGLLGGVAANVRAPAQGSLPSLPPKVRAAPATPEARNVQTLKDAQVFMTPGQKAGGAIKNAEDLAARAPLLGAAIKGARGRSVKSLNRAVADEALKPLGAYLPSKVATGHDAVRHVADTLGSAYDEAAAMVPETQIDTPFIEAKGAISTRLLEQPETVSKQFDQIVNNRLGHLLDKPVSGQQIRDAQSQISKLAADFSSSDDGAQRALGGALDDLGDELGNVIGRANPEAATLIDKANTGWSVYTRMRNAASKAKGGVFTPGQLNTAVRTLDRSVGKGNVAKGQAVLQDLSNAAWEVLPDSYGNPGTADALSAFGLLGAAANPSTAPVALPAAAGLGAAAIPYMRMGVRNVERIPGAAGSSADPRQIEELVRRLANARVRAPSALTGGAIGQVPMRPSAPVRP